MKNLCIDTYCMTSGVISISLYDNIKQLRYYLIDYLQLSEAVKNS